MEYNRLNFEHCSPKCEISQVSEELLRVLNTVGLITNSTLVINSAFRSVDYEKSKNRPGTSSHTKGLAVDVQCLNNLDRVRLVCAFLAFGFCRIGIAKNYIHVDIDRDKQPSLWLYSLDGKTTY